MKDGTTEASRPWEITWVLFDAQAACIFSVKVMAAILRASVRPSNPGANQNLWYGV